MLSSHIIYIQIDVMTAPESEAKCLGCPLVAGCSIGHKPWLFHASTWAGGKIKKCIFKLIIWCHTNGLNYHDWHWLVGHVYRPPPPPPRLLLRRLCCQMMSLPQDGSINISRIFFLDFWRRRRRQSLYTVDLSHLRHLEAIKLSVLIYTWI